MRGVDDTLDQGIVDGVHEQHEVTGGGPLLQDVPDLRRVGVGDAHRCEHDCEGRILRHTCVGRHLRRELEVGQAADGEDRQLLAADERGQTIDRGHPGQDGVAWSLPDRRVDRAARRLSALAARDRRAAVERLSAPVAHPPEPAFADRYAQRGAREGDRYLVEAKPGRPLQDLDDGPVAVYVQHDPVADLAGVELDGGDLVPADAVDAFDHEQGPPDG